MEWQPIETVPTNSNVLIYFNYPNNQFIAVDEVNEEGEWMIAENDEFMTHWMSLPEPPK